MPVAAMHVAGGAGAPLIEKVRFAADSLVEGDGFEPNRLGHLYFRGRYSSSQTSSIRQLTSGRPLGRIPDAQEQPPGDRPHQIPRSANGNTQVQCDPADGGTPKASG